LKSYIKIGDVLICITLLFLALAGIVLPLLYTKQGDSIVIRVNNIFYEEVSLTEDRILEIKDDNLSICNTISIQEGKVHMVSATCQNQLCTYQSPISAANESIICLPNKVIIEVISRTNTQIDAVSE
jgi:Uncharacterized protein conserved in bacteria